MEEIYNLLDKICGNNYTTKWNKLNFKNIPITKLETKIGNEEIFNELYLAIYNNKEFTKIKRTNSGGISIARDRRLYYHRVYDVRLTGGCIELTVCVLRGHEMRSYRIQFRNNNYKIEDEEELVSGIESFFIFFNELKADGIDLKSYNIPRAEGEAINKQIHKPDIRLMNEMWNMGKREFNHAYHLDFHKAYMSGLRESHPEFAPAIDRIAEKAKTSKKYKTAMAATIGYFHSPCCGYHYAHLAKDAINTFYAKYDKVLKDISKDRLVIATNTDGIWYDGPEWHGDFEKSGLGGWSTDHKDCKLSFKSAGSYQYMEDGKCHPVVRGRTRLDKIKPRSEWKWDDIYHPDAIQEGFIFKEGEGIKWQEIQMD